MHAHFVGSSYQLYIDIKLNIIHSILRTLVLDLIVENNSINRALRFFDSIKSNNVTVCYQVHIKIIKLFKLVLGMFDLGSLFKLTACQVECARKKW